MSELHMDNAESGTRALCYWDDGSMQYIVTGYREVMDVLKNHRAYSSAGAISIKEPNGNQLGSTTILLSDDPPRHTNIRNLVNRWFAAKELERLRPWIETTTSSLLDRCKSEGVEIIGSLAEPLPVMSVAHLLGLDPANWETLKRWSLAASGMNNKDDSTQSLRNVFAMYKFFAKEIKARRNTPQNDLITRMISENISSVTLSDSELQAFCILLLAAGNETTINLISNMINALCDRTDIWQALRRGEMPIASVIEESLRRDSPVQFIRRIANVDTDIAGCHIPAGSRVGLHLGAANRDPSYFSDPDTFDPHREQKHHLAFSHGIHFCLGASLARMEAAVVLRELVRRYTGVTRIDDGVSIDSTVMKGLESLTVRFVCTPLPA